MVILNALVLFAATAAPQQSVADQLLALEVPAESWHEHLEAREVAGEILPDWPPKNLALPDNAPLEKLIEFWKSPPKTGSHGRKKPILASIPTRIRLFEAIATRPEIAGDLMASLAMADEAASLKSAALKAYESVLASGDLHSAETLKRRLMLSTEYFRDELTTEAGKPTATGFEALQRLTSEDWKSAEQVHLNIVRTSVHVDQVVSSLAALLADADASNRQQTSWRAKLRKIVANTSNEPQSRLKAIDALLKERWEGDGEWFVGLLSSDDLFSAPRNSWDEPGVPDIAAQVLADPDRLIPIITPQVGSSDKTIHNNAVRCLIQFQLEDARADALEPLLPWLSEPGWATVPDSRARLRLIQSLDRVKLPDSIPGLLWALDHGTGHTIKGAAESLRFQGAKEALPAMKRILVKLSAGWERRFLISAIADLGGFAPEEIVDALEAYSERISTREGKIEVGRIWRSHIGEEVPKLVPKISVGKYYSERVISDSGTIDAIATRLEEALGNKPFLAKQLSQIVTRSNSDEAISEVVRRLKSGDLDSEWASETIAMRNQFSQAATEMEALAGEPEGLRVALSMDQSAAARVLDGQDSLAKKMLFACARQGEIILPIKAIKPIFESGNSELIRAASYYLVALGSADARELLTERGDEMFKVTGSESAQGSRGSRSARFQEWEKKMASELLGENAADEVIALLSDGGWGSDGQRFITVRNNTAECVLVEKQGRYQKRRLKPEELYDLKSYLETYRFEDLPPYNSGTSDGIEYVFLHLTKKGGRRVYMNNPPTREPFFPPSFVEANRFHEPAKIYGILVEKIYDLCEREMMSAAHKTIERLPGYEVLREGSNESWVSAVSGEGGKIRMLIRERATDESKWSPLAAAENSSEIAVPPTFSPEMTKAIIGDTFDHIFHDRLTSEPWQARVGDAVLVPWKYEKLGNGIWLCKIGETPERVASGQFGSPVVVPSGEWAIAARATGDNWSEPNSVYRINISNKELTAVELPPANDLQAIAYISAHLRVLIHRKDIQNEYFLLDASTGDLQNVSGNFVPLLQQTWRPLQPTEVENVVWAAQPSESTEGGTSVGRYDTKNFEFTPVLAVPGVTFDSMDMWVDETAQTVYIVTSGDLVKLEI